jgi:hypothetical protein
MFVVSTVWTVHWIVCVVCLQPLIDELSRLVQGARRPYTPSMDHGGALIRSPL